MKYRSKKICGHGVSVNQISEVANYILFATFCFMGSLVRRKKHGFTVPGNLWNSAF